VQLSAGTFDCSADILPLDNVRILGEGIATVINFSGGHIKIYNKSHVEMGNFRITGSPTPTGEAGIWLTADTNEEDFYFHDIVSEVLGCRAAFAVYPNAVTIKRITYDNCQALNVDGFGFLLWGEGACTVKNVVFDHCYAYRCGYAATRYTSDTESWVTGFDVAEQASGTYSDIRLIACLAEESWESGYHMEVSPTKRRISFIGCHALKNGQKDAATIDFGAGWMMGGDATVELINCTSDGDYRNFRWYGGAANAELFMDNCHGVNAVQDGLIIIDQTSGYVTIQGTSIKDAGRYGVYISNGTNITTKDLRIINATGDGSRSNYFGIGADKITNSTINVHAVGNGNNYRELQFDQATNVMLSGFVKNNNTQVVTLNACDDFIVKNLEVQDATHRAISVTGASGDVRIMDSVLRDTRATPSMDYGVWSDSTGSKPIVDKKTVKVIGETADEYYECSFVSNSGSSTGTGSQQTIAHGLYTTPSIVILSPTSGGADPYESASADATNIYVTCTNGETYRWYAEVEE